MTDLDNDDPSNTSPNISQKVTDQAEKYIAFCFSCSATDCKHIHNCFKWPQRLLLKYKYIWKSSPPGGLIIE